MHRRTLFFAATILLLLFAAVFLVWHTSQQAQLVPVASFVPAPQTQTRDCTMNGAHLPDLECTPGHIFPDITAKEVCQPGYAGSVRDVSQSDKERIYRTYNIFTRETGQYQVDHLISLALGGSNDDANLWPQPQVPRPGYDEKNALTRELHRQICDGRISVGEAQRIMSTDWVEGYERLVRKL